MYTDISELKGKILSSVVVACNEIYFTCTDGAKYKMFHYQGCCEDVRIEDICGDLQNLVGDEILDAREETNMDMPKKDEYDESFTWTFYILRTIKDTVTIRWYGTSNGYYSESVDFQKI
jgi:hypothetical protein